MFAPQHSELVSNTHDLRGILVFNKLVQSQEIVCGTPVKLMNYTEAFSSFLHVKAKVTQA